MQTSNSTRWYILVFLLFVENVCGAIFVASSSVLTTNKRGREREQRKINDAKRNKRILCILCHSVGAIICYLPRIEFVRGQFTR